MGIFKSKPLLKQNDAKGNIQDKINSNNFKNNEPLKIVDPDAEEQRTIEQMKTSFNEETEMFILNQLLMCFMFFDHYEKDIRKCANVLPNGHKEVSNKLIKEHQKELLLPDIILEKVCERVKFQEVENIELLQPLVPQKMYILHNNIEIDDKKYLINYSRIDQNNYRAEIEESDENKGFVKLNLVKTPRNSKQKRTSIDSSYSELEKINERLEKEITINDKTPSTSRNNETNDSGFNTESDYGYKTITASKTPQVIEVTEINKFTSVTQLPRKCITEVQLKNISRSDSDTDDDESVVSCKKCQSNEQPLFITNYYLNSTEFMEHFKSNVFPNFIGEILEFSPSLIEKTKSIYGALYCDTIDDNNNKLTYQILPAIPIAWPDEIAFEWCLRKRATVREEKADGTTVYKWPTDNMIQQINKLSCVLIPKGFLPKKSVNPEMHIEWEIDFPKAERFLELRMSHAQMRCFLYIIIIFRRLIEPKTETYGILVEHIRHLMFWECEGNYLLWPEHKLGIKILSVLQNLLNYLSKRFLPHYFIRSKNLLLNIPNKHIITTMEILQDIIRAPVLNFILAFQHLRYSNAKFYQLPNLEELLQIIIAENAFSPAIQASIAAGKAIKTKKNNKTRSKNKSDKELEWDRRYIQLKLQKNLRILKNNSEINEKNLIYQSDDEVSIQERFHDDVARQIRLLSFFIDNFIEISKRSYKVSSTNQTMLYLKQAWYLTKLLEPIDKQNALKYQEIIRVQEEKCLKKKAMEPKTPNPPTKKTFTSSNILNIKGKEINIGNLSKSYSDTVAKQHLRNKSQAKEQSKKEEITVDVHSENNKNKAIIKLNDSKEEPRLKTDAVSSIAEPSSKVKDLEIIHNLDEKLDFTHL